MSSVRELIERLVEQQNSVVGLAALAGSSAIEYVFPPFPGDFVTVLGAVLVTGYGWSFPLVLGAVMLGSIAGTLAAHELGVLWAKKKKKSRPIVEGLVARFQRHGPAYMMLNRFVPGIRALFFVAAGLAGIPRRKVVLYGGLSALLWNLGLMGLGLAVGANLDRLESIVARYTLVAWIVIAVIVLVAVVRWRLRSREDTHPE